MYFGLGEMKKNEINKKKHRKKKQRNVALRLDSNNHNNNMDQTARKTSVLTALTIY